jgi:hypothetical protein
MILENGIYKCEILEQLDWIPDHQQEVFGAYIHRFLCLIAPQDMGPFFLGSHISKNALVTWFLEKFRTYNLVR